MTDRFYAVFRVIPDDSWGQKTLLEAEDFAARYAEKEPKHTFFVMKTITKYEAQHPIEVIRTEIKPEEANNGQEQPGAAG